MMNQEDAKAIELKGFAYGYKWAIDRADFEEVQYFAIVHQSYRSLKEEFGERLRSYDPRRSCSLAGRVFASVFHPASSLNIRMIDTGERNLPCLEWEFWEVGFLKGVGSVFERLREIRVEEREVYYKIPEKQEGQG